MVFVETIAASFG